MSSSASPPSNASTPSGKCVVCGKNTHLRCGECLREGTTEQWFCSIEHKKLVWPLHKRFCGVRSNPFQWPGLSAAEYNEFARMDASQAKVAGFDIAGEHKAEWVSLQTLTFGERVPASLNDPIVFLRKSLFEATLDEIWTNIKLGKQDSKLNDSELAGYSEDQLSWITYLANGTQYPIDAAIFIQERILPGLASSPQRWGNWWSTFQHKFITWHAVRQVYMVGDRSEEMANHVEYCQKEVIRFCRETVSLTHPREASKFVDAIAGDRGARIF
ncbi:hypothetical protein JCM5350_000763 [Sporobolomyces pararoseus]